MLTKELTGLLNKRAKLKTQLEKETRAKRQRIAQLIAEVDALEATPLKKIADIDKYIIAAAEQMKAEVFADAKSHTHAGVTLKLTSGSAVVTDESEDDTIRALENDRSGKAKLCLNIKTTLNKRHIQANWKADAEWFEARGIRVETKETVKMTEEEQP